MRKNIASPHALQVTTFAEITSAHGFAFFMASSCWLSKAAWLSLILLGCFFSIFFTVKICLNSLSPPFFSTQFSIESMSSAPLPDIVLCDPSPWDLEKSSKKNISIQLLSYISYLLFPLSVGVNISTVNQNFKTLDESYRMILTKFDNNPIYLLNNITKDCSQIVLLCQLGTTKVLENKECCLSLFSNVEYTQNYKCYSSGGKIYFTMWGSAPVLGITVSVRINYITLDINLASLWTIVMQGIAVAVTEPKSNLFYVSQTDMNLLASNTYSSIAVERKELDSSDKDSYFLPYQE